MITLLSAIKIFLQIYIHVCVLMLVDFYSLLTMARQPGISPIEQYVIDRVKKMRQEFGISQAELAHKMDVSEGFIGNVENPKYRAKYSLYHLALLAMIFECSPKDFLPDTV